jgi:NAD(P)-dependent dehydrogenase (short-subunit alcohol dehydrogenase family)
MFSLAGKTAFVTGGTAGIGRAVAAHFVKAGARVAVAGRRAEGEAIGEAIGARFMRVDCAQEDAVREALEHVERELGQLDVLVNNAGLENTGPTIEDQGGEELRRVFALNVDGVYWGLRHGPRHMSDGASIINTSSVSGLVGIVGYGQYGATKAAVNSLTKTAALELAPRRIRVNAVCPGSIYTEMLPAGHPEIPISEVLTPLGRIGQVEDVVGLYHFLAADESAYVTGQTIAVDGGIAAGVGFGVLEKIAG